GDLTKNMPVSWHFARGSALAPGQGVLERPCSACWSMTPCPSDCSTAGDEQSDPAVQPSFPAGAQVPMASDSVPAPILMVGSEYGLIGPVAQWLETEGYEIVRCSGYEEARK